MNSFTQIYLVLSLVCINPFSFDLIAQDKSESSDEKNEKKKEKSIEELTKDHQKSEGIFTFYRNDKDGSLQMEISENQLDKNYIHFAQISNGALDAKLFKGVFKDAQVFKISKFYDKLEFTLVNTNFYFDKNSALAKSKDANISHSIIANVKIEAHDKKTGKYLIKADPLFLKETFVPIKTPKNPASKSKGFSLGKLDDKKSKLKELKNYPENAMLEVEYVYSSASVIPSQLSNSVADGRNISVSVYHSILNIPDNDYEIRLDDPKVGYFLTQVNDQTSNSATPYRDLIHRWNLKKKDPSADLSEPVKPIVWWMENTTPKELRPIIKKAGERWNIAFEAAGFKNAIVMKQQPDDADWDAGDIRYNVLRWTASPTPPWGGYGPSFVNPLTGEIIGADIMLEYASIPSLFRMETLFDGTGVGSIAEEIDQEISNTGYHKTCKASLHAQMSQFFGAVAQSTFDDDEIEKSKLIEEYIYYLILHEMGHTLGLNHNMKSSQLHNLKDINNTKITEKTGLMGSVMDYPAINFSNDRKNQGQYYTTTPGPYDIWAIQFGYQPMTNSEREQLLQKSTQPELLFGNDADDMRSPGKAIDPRVNIFDLTSDALAYSESRIELTTDVGKNLLKKYQKSKKGDSFQELLYAYYSLMREQTRSASTVSRYIGGIYIDRSVVGQKGSNKPYEPVPLKDQKRAMQILNDHVFSPEAFDMPNELYNYIAKQRRGFNFFAQNEDPKIHDRILSIQTSVLTHLLHKNTLQRIIDTELYGNKYTISAMMDDLKTAIFDQDIKGDINTFRQNLQLAYTKMLINMVSGSSKNQYPLIAQSMALYNLKQIKSMAGPSGNIVSMAHKMHLNQLIDNTMKEVK